MGNIFSFFRDRFTSTSTKFNNLPDDIVMNVLERLPLTQVFQARVVCKEWNSFISSSEFLNLYYNQSSKSYFPIIMGNNQKFDLRDSTFIQQGIEFKRVIFGYDHTTGHWLRFPPLKSFPNEIMVPIAATKGVLCFRGISSLFVYNIMMQKLTMLPPITKEWNSSLDLTEVLIDWTNGFYKVIMIDRNISNNHGVIANNGVAIYESNSRTWKVSKVQLPSHVQLVESSTITCNTIVCCQVMNTLSGKFGIMTYDIKGDTWQKLAHDIPSISYIRYGGDGMSERLAQQLVECNGIIYTVIVQGFFTQNYCFEVHITRIEIFKFKRALDYTQQKQGDWTRVAQLFDYQDNGSLFEDLTYIQLNNLNDWKIVCIGHGDKICISNIGYDFTLIYNIKKRQWCRLVPCPQLLSFPYRIACGLKI